MKELKHEVQGYLVRFYAFTYVYSGNSRIKDKLGTIISLYFVLLEVLETIGRVKFNFGIIGSVLCREVYYTTLF